MNMHPPAAAPSHTIGAILVNAGRLKAADVDRIARLARRKNLRFGDAAQALGLLSADDIDYALSRQFDFPRLEPGESNVSEEVFAAYQSEGPRVEALRSLRAQLMGRWLGTADRKTLALVSPANGDGRSFLTANLAVVFAQLGFRTLVIDADMRKPRQHELFGFSENRTGLSAMLSGRAGREAIRRIPSMPGLALLSAGSTPPNPQDLLLRGGFGQLLDQAALNFDVILLDTPAGATSADAAVIGARAGGALLVARKDETRADALRKLAEAITTPGGAVIGVTVNEIR